MAELKDNQLLAVQHLLDGKTVTETANLVGVRRQRVHEWHRDPVFQHELAARRADRQAAFERRWLQMADKVAARVESALDSEDPATALRAAALWLRHYLPKDEAAPEAFDPVLERVRYAREELRREVTREFTLDNRPLQQPPPMEEELTRHLRGTDYVEEEVERRLPQRLRELGITDSGEKQAGGKARRSLGRASGRVQDN